MRRGPASGIQTEKFFRSVTKSLGGNHGPSHSSMLNAPNSSRPRHVPTPMPVLCPGMPFPPLSTWQTFILQTSSGGSPRIPLMPPPIMSIVLSLGLLSPPSTYHLNRVPGSPVGSPYNLVESLQGGGGPESPQRLPSSLPTLSLRLAPCGQELSQGSSYLGDDLVHVSGSRLQSPGPWVGAENSAQAPCLSPGAAWGRDDRRPRLAAPTLWAGPSPAASHAEERAAGPCSCLALPHSAV